MTPAGVATSAEPPLWAAMPPDDPATGLALDLWRWDLGDPASAVAAPPSARDMHVSRRTAKDDTLRRVLARYLCCEPGGIVFGRSARGRPFIADPRTPLDFNLSDSRNTVVLAVTRRGQVGVDIEYHRTIRDPIAIAHRLLPAAWVDELAYVAVAEQPAMFFSLWTRFEACQKARGQGVFAPRTAQPQRCFGAFLAAPACSGHVCIAGARAVPDRKSWRFFEYPADD